ncbi:MAG: Cytochrome c protein, partial [Acidobacteria bacterium]|nr:Cytochrome c protein [Acidobacteriota bacterium]
MTTRVARWWNPTRLLLSGSGVLFLAVGTWVVFSAARLESAPAQAPVVAQRATASSVYKAVYNGWKWWHVYCFRCHGT